MKLILLIVLLAIEFPLIFAESFYLLEIDEHVFQIHYEINANVLAMDIDKEQKSLLIGIDNTQNSVMTLEIPDKVINAEKNEFVILLDGIEIDYILELKEGVSKFSFYVPQYSEEVEIIGTHVIPEFPIGLFVFLISVTAVVALSKKSNLILK